MIPLILKISLSVLLFYSSFVSVYINLIKKQFDFLSLFLSFSLCSLCLLLFYNIYHNIKNALSKKEKINSKNTPPTYFLAICFASLLIGFFNVSSQYSRDITEEESYQFIHSNQYNTITESYKQQQTPLDYYFSNFSGQLFKNSKFAVRFHTVYFYLLLCLLLPFGLYYYSSLLPASLASLLFLTNHISRFYAINARPLNLSLFTGFLFLFFYIQFFNLNKKTKRMDQNSRNNPEENQNSLIPVLSSQYLFILSIGLQPIIFIITLFISSFLLFFYSQKEIFKQLFLSHIITAGLSLPFYLKMINYGNEASKFKDFSLSSFFHYLSEWNLVHFIQKYFFTFYDKMFLSFLLPFLAWVLLIIFKKIKIDKKTTLLLSSIILFPLIFDYLFKLIIWYNIHEWYFITFSLLLIFSFLFICQSIFSYLKYKKYYSYILIPFLILFSGNIYLQNLQTKQKINHAYPYGNNNIKRVYDYLQKNGTPIDFLVEVGLRPPLHGYSLDIISQKAFLYKPETHPTIVTEWLQYTKSPPFFYENNSLQLFYINWNIKPYNKSQKVFFLSYNKIKKEDISKLILSKLLPKKIIGQFAIFELTLSSNNKKQEYIRFLHTLRSKTPKKYQSSLLETLIYYAYKRKNKLEFHKLLREYINLREYLPKYSQRFKYPIHFDHQRRIKFFESLNWN